MAFLQIYWSFYLASIVVFCVPAIYAVILQHVVVFFFSCYPDNRENKNVEMKTLCV